MAFTVQMRVEPELEKALAAFKVSESQRALVITIKSEAMHMELDGPLAKTSDFAADLNEVQAALKKVGEDTASYVLCRIGDKQEHALIMYIPVDTKPKIKMMFASSALHLRNSCSLGIAGETRIEEISALVPKLFNHPDEEKKEMRTEQEVVSEEISKMEVAPQGGVPHGLDCVLSPELKTAVNLIKEKRIKGVVAGLDGKNVTLEGKIEKDTPNADVHKCIEASVHPRYAVIQWEEDKIIMAYVCPASAKPREKMPYASTKPSFVKCVEAEGGFKIIKSVEMPDVTELEQTVKEHLADLADGAKDMEQMKPVAPAPKMAGKGPRMLM